ncbi:MAG: rod shape-determining protein MreC [Armatimonadota bacterium]|nr:rod shape-determining protein MreC [Armatimonadota bacterium]MDW8157124.1 rod shape-determining protein MreC [Armatimonadota bacterium]
MILAGSRRRVGLLAALVVVAGVLLTLQVRSPEGRQVGPVGRTVLSVLVPAQVALARAADAVMRSWRALNEIGQLRAENARLRAQVEALRREVARLQEASVEAERLRRLLGFRAPAPYTTLAARVVSRDPSRWYTTLTVDRGSRDGVARGDPVVTAEGLVGRVFEVYPTAALVLLVTDPRSAVGVLVQSTRDAGVVEGTATERLRLRYLSRSSPLGEGDVLVTSGLGGVFPRGIRVGVVRKVERKVGALFQEAEVEPATDLSRVEEVLVLVRQAPPR